jgi:hypothetical protein
MTMPRCSSKHGLTGDSQPSSNSDLDPGKKHAAFDQLVTQGAPSDLAGVVALNRQRTVVLIGPIAGVSAAVQRAIWGLGPMTLFEFRLSIVGFAQPYLRYVTLARTRRTFSRLPVAAAKHRNAVLLGLPQAAWVLLPPFPAVGPCGAGAVLVLCLADGQVR